MKCYELKICCFNGTGPKESKCQPYKQQIGCWEYDWVGFYMTMPDCSEKYEWRDAMLGGCPECVVYKQHKEEIDYILEGLRSS
ncbi:MAG: hypothetical protein ACM3TR_13260 [Caulobacteraceae bacterium]